mgnify:CR=1 FL=1
MAQAQGEYVLPDFTEENPLIISVIGSNTPEIVNFVRKKFNLPYEVGAVRTISGGEDDLYRITLEGNIIIECTLLKGTVPEITNEQHPMTAG